MYSKSVGMNLRKTKQTRMKIMPKQKWPTRRGGGGGGGGEVTKRNKTMQFSAVKQGCTPNPTKLLSTGRGVP